METENRKFRFLEGKEVDAGHFRMFEGKFLDTEQMNEGKEICIYANVSDFDTATFEESEVRIYAYPYEEMYLPETYELDNAYDDEEEMRSIREALLISYHQMKFAK